MNSLLQAPEPANLPVLRRPATVAVRTLPATPPKRGRVWPLVIAATVVATPFAGLMISLVGGA